MKEQLIKKYFASNLAKYNVLFKLKVDNIKLLSKEQIAFEFNRLSYKQLKSMI